MAKKKSTVSKKIEKTAKKQVKKAAKKHPVAVLVIVLILLLLLGGVIGAYFGIPAFRDSVDKFLKGSQGNSSMPETSLHSSQEQSHEVHSSEEQSREIHSADTGYEAGDADPISFHFLELGNANTGDSTFIKAGDNDILIDAGSKYGSATSIKKAVYQYCTDGKLELFIATHAHMDHISGFTHSNAKASDGEGTAGIFYNYKVGTIIDFARTDSTAGVVSYYNIGRDYAISQGAVHFSAKQCYEAASTGELGSANRVYNLGKNLTMEVLTTKFYSDKASTENDYSVCVLFRQGKNSFLFTGDLELDGEESLMQLNALPKVELFKGGHHGSYTAALASFYDVIQPKRVAVCCCAGNTEYSVNPARSFPTQEFIDAAAPYTKDIYATTLGSFTDASYSTSLNGQINMTYDANGITLDCSNNNYVLGLSSWFNKTNDLYTKEMVVSYGESAYKSLGIKEGYTNIIERNPSKPSTFEKGTRCLTEYKITQTFKSVASKKSSSGKNATYFVTYDCVYEYVDAKGVRHNNETSMPNRLWPSTGVALA